MNSVVFSPGRSPSCCDHEIIMMNHVYKERFPKVSNKPWFFFRNSRVCIEVFELSGLFLRPQHRWRNASRRSSAAAPQRTCYLWRTECLASPITRSSNWHATAWRNLALASSLLATFVSSLINSNDFFKRWRALKRLSLFNWVLLIIRTWLYFLIQFNKLL